MFFQKLPFPPKTFKLLPSLSFSNSPTPPPLPIHRLLSSPHPTLDSLLPRHALILTSGNSTNPFLASKLISLYSSFHRPHLSDLIFNSIPPLLHDTFLWNSIIKAHFFNADFSLSLSLCRQMLASGTLPNQFTVPMVVSACAELQHIGCGSSLHGVVVRLSLFPGDSVGVGSSLVYMYSKCGVVSDAVKVFDEMPIRDVVSWTALIVGCVRNDECELGLGCLKEMHGVSGVGGVRPNSRTLGGGFQACGMLGAVKEGRCLHGLSVKSGLCCCPSIKSVILSMYSKFDCLEEARLAFNDLPERDVVSCTAIMGAFARKGLIEECLVLFRELLDSQVEPDGVLLSCLLMSFGNFHKVFVGKAFHGFVLRRNYELDAVLVRSLLSMYCKLDLLDSAERVFNNMGKQDPESWNLMVSGYGKIGFDNECLDLFREMQFVGLGMDTDLNSLVSVISSCSLLGALLLGQSVHCFTIKKAVHEDPSASNAIVGMYGRCGRLELARRIFDQIRKDVVTWNTLITAYAHTGYSSDALSLFDEMLLEGAKPNSTTLMSVLSACSHMAALDRGKWIHNYIKEMRLEHDVSLSTALVDLYAKCGQLGTSRELFDSMFEKDVVSWNVMISAYGMHGDAKEALRIFRQMERTNMKPNGVTFLALLSACSHEGLVEQGKSLFLRMRDYSITPTLKHYACMVDLLGRYGSLSEAEEMVLSMPIEPDGGIWGTLLGACNIYKDVEMGERIAERAFKLDPENEGYYVLMSNMYGCAGRWEEVERLRDLMRNRRVRKKTGWSSVELEGRIHVFAVCEKSHPHFKEISLLLEVLGRQMEDFSSFMKIEN